jgi:hypothetical protein
MYQSQKLHTALEVVCDQCKYVMNLRAQNPNQTNNLDKKTVLTVAPVQGIASPLTEINGTL